MEKASEAIYQSSGCSSTCKKQLTYSIIPGALIVAGALVLVVLSQSDEFTRRGAETCFLFGLLMMFFGIFYVALVWIKRSNWTNCKVTLYETYIEYVIKKSNYEKIIKYSDITNVVKHSMYDECLLIKERGTTLPIIIPFGDSCKKPLSLIRKKMKESAAGE